MRPILLASFLLASSSAVAQTPALRALADWQGGKWLVSVADRHTSAPICIADPETMLTGGRPHAGCTFTVIHDEADSAAVTYRCPGGRQGRTTIRRDAQNIYMIDAQGVAHGLPFGDRAEWRRAGAC